MVAELTSITTSSAGGKTSVNSLGRVRSASKLRKRPKWIQTATREPIYSVLDSNETTTRSYPPGFKDNVVVISAVKSRRDSSRGKFKSKLIPDEQRELPYVWLPPENNNNVPDSPTLEVEDEYALYSVVKKPKKVAPASKSSCAKKFLQQKNTTEDKEIRCGIASQEEAFSEKVSPRLRLTNEQEDRRGQGRNRQVEKGEAEILSRQEALRKWLQFASSQLPEPSRLFDFSEMYENEVEDVERVQADWKRSIAMPRGVVGLVGPYRIYQNPNERREYMLQEEELVEEIVDSVNGDVVRENPVASENREENRQRAKWNIRENDEENLVPEIRGRADLEDRKLETSFKEKDAQSMSDWKNDDTTDTEKNEWKGDVDSRIVEGILSGKEERAIDVPDGASATSTASPTVQRASNEHHDKDSLNETGSTTGGTVEGGPAGSPSRGDRTNENDPSAAQTSSSSALPPKSLVSRILARARSSDDLLDHSEPFSQLWIVLSNVYGELVVVLMMALCLAEVMDTPVPLLSLQGAFLMYLYVGSIAVIISIYVWVLVDSCGSLSGRGAGIDDAELGGASLTRFGSLKKAHISRARTAPTSFYIRVGALLFGLATLVFNGLEMAMHTMMQGAECLSDVVFVHPVLHGLFTFLQMHFLFVNSQVLVERFGLAARFGFTHLAATNIAVWARLVIWDSAQEWTYYVHLAQRGLQTSASPLNLRGFPGSLTRQSRDIVDDVVSTEASVFRPYQPISDEQISQVVALQECINTNTLGQLWTSSMPFLYPFIVQFSLIAAAVTFVMGQNVGKSRHSFHSKQKFHSTKDLTSNTRVGCDGSSKGLFLGILCMVAGIVVILIFLVVREDDNFPPTTLSWLTCGTLIAILTLSILMTASGLVQIRQMSVVTRAPAALDGLLTNVALFGVELYSVFTIVVCTCSLVTLDEEELRGRYTMLLSVSILQLVQSFAQSTLIAEASKRSCITRFQMVAKPGRQVITFLLFSNAVLWAFDTVVTQNWLSQELQLRFFGVLAWGVLSRIGLPLLIFYRFHSCVLLLEAWNKCYRTPRGEHPLN